MVHTHKCVCFFCLLFIIGIYWILVCWWFWILTCFDITAMCHADQFASYWFVPIRRCSPASFGYTSVQGRWYRWWKKSCTSWYGKYPIVYMVLYIPGGGAGFLPSTVAPLIWKFHYGWNPIGISSGPLHSWRPMPCNHWWAMWLDCTWFDKIKHYNAQCTHWTFW